MVFQDGSGISWTICKQSTPCFRQITTPRPHYSILQAGCSSWRPTNSIKALKAQAWYEKYIAVKHFWPENHSSPSPWVVNQGHKLRSRVSTDSTVVGLTSILDRGHLDLQYACSVCDDVTLQSSSSKQSVVVDCRKSQNITSHQPTGLLCTIDVAPKSAVVCQSLHFIVTSHHKIITK